MKNKKFLLTLTHMILKNKLNKQMTVLGISKMKNLRNKMINRMSLVSSEILKMQNKIFKRKKMNGMNLIKTMNLQMIKII